MAGLEQVEQTGDANLPELLPVELRNFADRAGRLKQWPKRMKLKVAAIAWLATHFEPGVNYTERDVNRILMDWHTFRDWTMLRRYLVDLGYLEREANGSRYWRTELREPATG